MKSTIGKKILLMIFIPFFVIFGTLSGYTYATIIQYATNWMELEIKGIADINAADLEGRMESVRTSVLSMAGILEGIDSQSADARKRAEEDIKTLFVNDSIYNIWLAYEPQAFDGKDEEYTLDYPGAPSGRFIRSFVLEDGQIIVAPDMEESTLDDPEESPWYTVPRDTKQLYIDVDNDNANLYDYGVGQEEVYTLSIVSPIYRDGRVIGCIGADMLFDNMTFSIGSSRQAVVAVFYPNGRIFYSPSTQYAEETVETLQFENVEQIKETIVKGKPIFLADEYSIFADARAFTYFRPIYDINSQEGSLCLYVAAPRRPAFAEWTSIFAIVGGITICVFIVLVVMFMYVIRKVSRPIRELILAAESISKGNIETEITYFSETKDEIGLLSRSLHRMVEQFRIYIMNLERTQEEMSLHSQMEDIIKGSGSVGEIFDEITAAICNHFQIYKATIVYGDVGKGTILSCHETENERTGHVAERDFLQHAQVEQLLSGKKLVFMNSYTIAAQKVDFVDARTSSVCLMPIGNEKLWGYIILENQGKRKALNASNESALLYIAKILNDWVSENSVEPDNSVELSKSSEPDNSVELDKSSESDNSVELGKNSEPDNSMGSDNLVEQFELLESVSVDDSKFFRELMEISGLEVEQALAAMGGLKDVYEKSVRLTARLIPETVEKMDDYIAEKNAKSFAIEIHGMKGVFNNIGAFTLGNDAADLEKAALAEDVAYVSDNYRTFRAKVMDFSRQLISVTADEERWDKKQGDKKILRNALKEAAVSVKGFDSLEAFEILSPLADFSFDGETDMMLTEIIRTLEVFNCENAGTMIQKLEKMLEDALLEGIDKNL